MFIILFFSFCLFSFLRKPIIDKNMSKKYNKSISTGRKEEKK